MGLLYIGTALTWEECSKYADHVRSHGITQFLHTWDRLKDRQGDELLWGDEVEYMVVAFDHAEKSAKLSLRQTEILEKLRSIVDDLSEATEDHIVVPTFHPEYGRYMLESTPGSPYTGYLSDLLSVEKNMRYRRSLARKHLRPNEIPLSFTSFPRLGTPGVFAEPYFDPKDAVSSHSLFLPQEITNPHVRFPTLTANIRTRRGSKVAINLPIYVDTNTPRPFIDPTTPWDRDIYPEDSEAKNGAALPDHIYMDAMGFGMGCCCLQLTFQACSVTDARRLYDAFVPVGPIMLALTAASPFWRGYVSDVDCRWNVIAGSVDDRTEEERGLKPLSKNKFVIPKSRYDSVDLYISEDWINRPEYNDSASPFDPEIYDRLRAHGLDEQLAKHIAHLFIRDPLVVFSEAIDLDDNASMDHFENIQSTNWQTVRFKPPPPDSEIGWRVEFRSMEVQATDFENAAFAVFIVLLSRAILYYRLNFYAPISKVDENMQTAQKRNAARTEKFYFRKNVFPPGSSKVSSASSSVPTSPLSPSSPLSSHSESNGYFNGIPNGINGNGVKHKEKKLRNCFPAPPPPEEGVEPSPVGEEYELMTLEEIMLGKGEHYPGLLGLVYAFMETLDFEEATGKQIRRYLELVKRRSNGSLMTLATWMRNFVSTHPEYKHDSVVSQEVNYDLLVAVDEIERGTRKAPDLLPEDYSGGAQDSGSLTPP